jgi:hypothetical protein
MASKRSRERHLRDHERVAQAQPIRRTLRIGLQRGDHVSLRGLSGRHQTGQQRGDEGQRRRERGNAPIERQRQINRHGHRRNESDQ